MIKLLLVKICSLIRYKIDNNFRLFCKTRSRIHHALNGKSKSSSTKEISGIGNHTNRKWIAIQLTPEMTWDKIGIMSNQFVYLMYGIMMD